MSDKDTKDATTMDQAVSGVRRWPNQSDVLLEQALKVAGRTMPVEDFDAVVDAMDNLRALAAKPPTSHAPLPWHVGPHYRNDVEAVDGRVCECTPMGAPRSIANAALIVRAANHHHALVEALRACVNVMSVYVYPKPDVPEIHPWRVLSRARTLLEIVDRQP